MEFIKNTMIIKEYKYLNSGMELTLNSAFSSSDKVKFQIEVPRSYGTISCEMQICYDGYGYIKKKLCWEKHELALDFYSIELDFNILCGNNGGLLYYNYILKSKDSSIKLGGEEIYALTSNTDRQLLIYSNNFNTPAWMNGAIIYHIFVDRFFKGGNNRAKEGTVINNDWYKGDLEFGEYQGAYIKNNSFFGGDLWGIAKKLDYIDSLGVNCIYLSPIFDSASNHKYDTGNYMSVDSMFGGDDAFNHLIEKANQKGIKIILDGVFSHTGDNSLYFNKYGNYNSLGAYQSEKSIYRQWYNFKKDGSYDSWWNIEIMPKLNTENSDYQKYILGKNGVIEKWMKQGVSGWRLDVADELSNNFLELFRTTVKNLDKDSVIIGEVWEDASNKISYGKRRKYFQGKQLDSVMNYPFREAVISYIKNGDFYKFKNITEGICRRYPKNVINCLMNFLGTHDTVRIITALGGEDQSKFTNKQLSEMKMQKPQYETAEKLIIMAYMLISILPGATSIYYGDEIGMEGYGDPFCRKPYPWGKENKKLLSIFQKIGSIKKNYATFRDGEYNIEFGNSNVLIVSRLKGNHKILLVVNRTNKLLNILFTDKAEGLIFTDEVSSRKSVPPLSGEYYITDKNTIIKEMKQ